MLYGQHWALLYTFAHDQHHAKLCQAAHYRLIKRLQQPAIQSPSRGSGARRWRQPVTRGGGAVTPRLLGRHV